MKVPDFLFPFAFYPYDRGAGRKASEGNLWWVLAVVVCLLLRLVTPSAAGPANPLPNHQASLKQAKSALQVMAVQEKNQLEAFKNGSSDKWLKSVMIAYLLEQFFSLLNSCIAPVISSSLSHLFSPADSILAKGP